MEHSDLITLPACPICGAAGRRAALQVKDHLLSHRAFDLQDCVACGFRFTDPRPASDQMERYYRSADYIPHSNSRRSISDKFYHIARGAALRSKYRTISREVRSGRLLDFGCGTGEFLRYMQDRGYSTLGIEPDPGARKQASGRHRLDVRSSLGPIEAMGAFDVITLWHVLEHVTDPSATLKHLTAYLATGGLLVIAVPERTSWDCSHYGPLWAAWDVPRHLSHFRRSDVLRLLRHHGFKIDRTRRMWFDAPYVSMLSERYAGRGPLTALLLGAFYGAWSNLVSLASARASSSMLFIAKRQ